MGIGNGSTFKKKVLLIYYFLLVKKCPEVNISLLRWNIPPSRKKSLHLHL
jgi:hypothetical protein